MSATDFKLRCIHFNHMKFTADGALTAGDMRIVEDTVVVVVADAADTADAIGVTRAEAIVLPKTAGSGIIFAAGDKVYYDDAVNEVTNSAGGNTLCGRANEAAVALDTSVEVNFSGQVAA